MMKNNYSKVWYYLLLLSIMCTMPIYGCSTTDSLNNDNVSGDTSSDDDESGDNSESDIDQGNDDTIAPDSDSTSTIIPDIVITDSTAVSVHFNGNSVEYVNPLQNLVNISVNGASIELTPQTEGIVISANGTSTNGTLKVYGEYATTIHLNGLNLSSASAPALNIQSHKKVNLIVEDGTANTLTDGTSYTATSEDAKGALFSEGQLIISGNGTLTVSGNAKHGICSDNYIRLVSGNIIVSNAVQDAIHTNTGFIQDGGSLTLTSTDDAIQVDEGKIQINSGTLNLTPGDDGLVTAYDGTDSSIDASLEINGGQILIATTGEKGMAIKSIADCNINGGTIEMNVSGKGSKGISCDKDLTIIGGVMTITTTGGVSYTSSSDYSSAAGIKCDGNTIIEESDITIKSTGAAGKGINCTGTFTINSGSVTINTSGSTSYSSNAKALKSKGNITINGGSIDITTKTNGAEGIESKKILTINGGEVVVSAYDDALNAASKIVFNGGKTYAYSSNNDAVDCNANTSGCITIAGGVLVACCNAGAPEEGIDCDNAAVSVTGGTLFSMGGASSVPTTSTAKQNTVLLTGISVSQNQYISLNSVDGTNIITIKNPCTRYSNGGCYSLITSPMLNLNETYTLNSGTLEPSDYTSNWNIVYQGGTYKGTTQLKSFTLTSSYTGSSTSSGGGGFRPR